MSQQSAKTPTTADLVTLNRAATMARLLSGAAHEVNNALQVIGGTTELLQTANDLPPSTAAALERIAQQTNRAAVAMAELLLFARERSDERVAVDLSRLVARAVSLRSFAIARAGISIAVEPAAGGPCVVNGSVASLQLALLNLIGNAEQALAGRAGSAIRIRLEEADGYVAVSVTDNGPGVDTTIAGQIFEPFFTTRSRDDASGLGLSIVQLVAEQHGGTIALEPSEAGAVFVLRLRVS